MKNYLKQNIVSEIESSTGKPIIKLSDRRLGQVKSIPSIILGIIALGGLLTVTAIAPNALQVIRHAKRVRRFFRSSLTKKQDQQRKLADSFYYLKSQGYIDLKKTEKGITVLITDKGRIRVDKINFEALTIRRQESWNKKWWVILADIPSKEFKIQADMFRRKVKSMNFYPLQRTVWVYPHDPRNEIAFLSSHFNIDRFVTVIEVSLLEKSDELVLKKYFQSIRLI